MNKKFIPGIVLLFAVIILGLRTLQIYQPGIMLDDAYISFRYAENLAQGHGLVFNLGERVEGYTNFLWTAILAAAKWLNFDTARASIGLAALSALGCLVMIYLLAQELFRTRKNSGLMVAFPVLCFAFMGSQARYVVSGMETLLFTFLLALSIYLVTTGSLVFSTGRYFLAGLAFAACALVRPEGLMYFTLALAYAVLIRPVHTGLPNTADEGQPKKWKVILLLVGGFLLVYGPYFIWRFNYFGDLLPNTYYVKATGLSIAELRSGWDYFVQVMQWWSILPVLVLALIGLWSARRNPNWLLFLALILSTAVYFLYVGGDFIVWFGPRFFIPVLPFLLLLGTEGLANLEYFRLRTRTLTYLQVALVVLLLANAYFLSWPSRSFGANNFTMQMRGWAELGRWLAAHTSPETTIATDAAGLIPYYSQRYTIDMFGLTDRHIAHLEMPGQGAGIVAHEKFDPAYIMSREPDCVVSTWLGEDGSALSAGLDTVKAEFDRKYALAAVAKVRGELPQDVEWVLRTSDYNRDLFLQGYLTGLFCRRGQPRLIIE